MYIGKINDKYGPIEWSTAQSVTGKSVQYKEAGDPFRVERLTIDWSELVPFGLELTFLIPWEIQLSEVVLRFGSKSEPLCVTLCKGDGSRPEDCYRGETGKAITSKEVVLSAKGYIGRAVIRIEADLSDVVLESIDLYGADLTGEQLYPTPRQIALGEKCFPIDTYNTFSVACAEAAKAAVVLREKLSEEAGVSLCNAEKGRIHLAFCADIVENGYALTADAEQILIEASDTRGFVQGVETLIKLIEDGKIPTGRIEDAPFCAFRGAHLFLPAPDQMDFAKRLIKYILSPMGYNYIIMEVAGALEFRSHPEINEAFAEANRRAAEGQWPAFPHGSVGGHQIVPQEMVRDLVDYARGYGIEIIPEIQSLGHVQFMTLAHPEIAERPADAPVFEATDERLADVPPNDFYAHCFCPSNPKSYEILFDLMDEIIAVFRPAKYVHMGHDEVYQIGVCPVCRQRDPADLFAEDIQRLHDYLADRGLTMMIWADMLQPVTKYKTPAAIDRIPKDIVMLDFIWYFHMDKDIEDNLLAEGFEVIMGNMYSSHYPRYESRIRKAGMRGAQVSAWVATEEESLAREGKLYDLLYSAQMLWSESYTGHARYSYDQVISARLPHLREQMRGVRYPSLHEHTEKPLGRDTPMHPDWGTCSLTVVVNGKFDSLLIEHTAMQMRHRLPWKPLEVIGTYTVTYADHTVETFPVTYGGNISHHGRRHHQPFTQKYYRHNGYTTAWETDGLEEIDQRGEAITYYRIEWINPRPDEMIQTISYRAVNVEPNICIRRVIGVNQ